MINPNEPTLNTLSAQENPQQQQSQPHHPQQPLQSKEPFLQNKREREDKSQPQCSECLSKNDKILVFNTRNNLMTFIYEDVLNPDIDMKIKNDLLRETLPNKPISISLCKNCLIKLCLTKGLYYMFDMNNSVNIRSLANSSSEPAVNMSKGEAVIEEKMEKIGKTLYKACISYIFKQIDEIKNSVTQNNLETEQAMNKMALLLVRHDNQQFEKFIHEMNGCKGSLKKNEENLTQLSEKKSKYDEINLEISKLYDKNIQRNISESKINQLFNFLKNIESDAPADLDESSNNNENEEKEKKSKNSNNTHDKKLIVQIQKSPKEQKLSTNFNQESASCEEPEVQGATSYITGDFQVESQPKVSYETNKIGTKKKNCVIQSSKPIHEISSSSTTKPTPITPLSTKHNELPILQQQPQNPPQNMGLNIPIPGLGLKPGQSTPSQVPEGIPQFAQPPLGAQHLQQPQLGIQMPQGGIPFYAPDMNNVYTLMSMKGLFPTGMEKIPPLFNGPPQLYPPQPSQIGQNPFLDLNQFMLQQQKMGGGKLNFPQAGLPLGQPQMNPMGNNPLYDQSGLTDREKQMFGGYGGGDPHLILGMFNEIAKQKDIKKGSGNEPSSK